VIEKSITKDRSESKNKNWLNIPKETAILQRMTLCATLVEMAQLKKGATEL
jgi:hypothetical protein